MVEGMHILDADSEGSTRLLRKKDTKPQHVVLPSVSHGTAAVSTTLPTTPVRVPVRFKDEVENKEAVSLTLSDIFPSTQHDHNDDCSLSIHDIASSPVRSHDEAVSAFTLDAMSHSVASSVTWYEGADITEEEVTTEDDDEQGMGRTLSSYEGSSSSSTPPPPMDILLGTPPPVVFDGNHTFNHGDFPHMLTNHTNISDQDLFHLDEVDSLDRVYHQRRRPRRYAATTE
jgi:hypothetical protein